MLTLIRLILQLFGIRVYSGPRWCAVTDIIESLPGSELTREFLGGILHILPVIVVLAYIFFW